MYIYSVTLQVDKSIEKEWLNFMQKKHINDVMKTGYFDKCVMRKGVPEKSSVYTLYNVEYIAKSEDDYIMYEYEFAQELRDETKERFGTNLKIVRNFYEVIFEK